MDGGGGFDVAVFSGRRADYFVSSGFGKVFVAARDGVSGFDTLLNIERLTFDDGDVSLGASAIAANGGQPSATSAQIANYLLTTVNKAAPDAATLAAAVTALNTETGPAQGNLLWHLAESAANQAQVGLVGLALTGLEFGG